MLPNRVCNPQVDNNNNTNLNFPLSELNEIKNLSLLTNQIQFELLRGIFSLKIMVKMTVYGKSMEPFIRDGDLIFLSPIKNSWPKLGEVIAYGHPITKKMIIHRLVKYEGEKFVLKGDNCKQFDEEIGYSHILGRVSAINRKDSQKNIGIGKLSRLIACLSRINIIYALNRIPKMQKRMLRNLNGKKN